MGVYTYVGTLTITAAPASFSYNGTLTGATLSLTSSFAVGINDSTGSGAGWNLQASAGTLTSGTDTIPTANHSITGASTAGVTGVAPVNGVAYPVVIPTGSGKIYNATTNTGTGQSTTTFATQLSVPPDTAAGTYSTTLTVTIAAGP